MMLINKHSDSDNDNVNKKLSCCGEAARCMSHDTSDRARGLSVFAECLAGGWLADISTNIREAVAH